jgi:CBS domain containing-hemolysin-like protein
VEHGAIDEDEGLRIDRVLQLSDLPISELTISRLAMPLVKETMTLGELAQPGVHSRHTRVIVQGDGADDIKGYIYMEEAFRSVLLGRNRPECALAEAVGFEDDDVLIREVKLCTKDVSASQLLKSMLIRSYQIVVVLDEHASVEGAVTLEELLEFVLDMDIRDEDDPIESVLEAARSARAARIQSLGAAGMMTSADEVVT